MLKIVLTTLIMSTSVLTATPQKYRDGRPAATLIMEAKDYGVVLRHGDGPEKCDILGARDVWVFEANGVHYMHYDAAGPKGWLCALAVSENLFTWENKGPILDLGKPDEDDSKSASYGVTYWDGKEWHMFYLGTPNTSKPPDLVPSFPYLTMKAKGNSPAGPLDYHLGGFRPVIKENFKPIHVSPNLMGTRCHQLAMYLVYESYLQLVCDYPSAYINQPGFDFIKQVPTTWMIQESLMQRLVITLLLQDGKEMIGTLEA
jgi:hypothetical protein